MEQKLRKIDLTSLNSYTLGPLIVSYSLAYEIYKDGDYLDIINLIFENTNFKIEVNEDAFLLLGLCYFHEYIPEFRENTLEKIEVITEEILKHQDKHGLFVFKNLSSKRHQNQMYTLWALNRAFTLLDRKNTDPIKKNIQYTIANRMQDDYGIIWENKIPLWFKLYNLAKKIRYWEYYFECHQCFFAHAVFEYAALKQDKEYTEHAKRALEWIIGRNRFGFDLLEFSGLGIPHRIVDSHGNPHIKGQQFKGTYEIGGYLMALTDYCVNYSGSK
ncbi:MAG: hypothetical protein PHV51_01685 [Methanosarcinaceae archaeon]|nr:hypothetical protein [Methanosarcinaceae archaeon]